MSDDDIDSQISNLEGRLNSVGISTEPREEQPKTIFDHESDKELTSDLGKIFDRAEGHSDAALAAKDVPSARADSFDQAFEATYDFLNSSEAERAVTRDASKLVETVKENAKRFGVELSPAEAMKAAMELEQQQARAPSNEYAEAEQAIRQHYPNERPAAIARAYADMESRLRADPVAGVSEIANRLGIHPMQLAQQIALQYQQQPPAADVGFVQNIVERAYAENPRMSELEDDIMGVLKSKNFKLTGNHHADLQRALEMAEKRDRKRSSADRMGRSMAKAYDKAASR